jgi:maltose O-acetyltransferase
MLMGKVRLRIRGEATFGARFMVEAHAWDVVITVAEGATLTVGEGVFVNGGVSIEVWHDVRIGSRVLMAPNASIIDDDRHELEPGAPLYHGPTVIGDGAWLGRNVTVLPGVTIGSGAVIGANSVVSRDIPPDTFAAGAPARVIKSIEVPDGWSHRYGYEAVHARNDLRSMLRRLRHENHQGGGKDGHATGAPQREQVSQRKA